MIENAMTLNEARLLCKEYEFMQGRSLDNKDVVVECVTISPADDINKWIFLHHYGTTHDTDKALDFYKVPFFDVIFITRCGEGHLSYITLNSFNNQHRKPS
jgi:hypothetical protein